MRFRRLTLRAQTTDGPYAVTLDFPDGLVVIWADNSMGKSTCVRSMLIALGMEAILTYSQSELPVSPALKSCLESERGEHTVLESEVFLEIENSRGEHIVTQRTIKGERDKNLITVHEGPALSSPGTVAVTRDYFVNREGAVTRENGFHHFLAGFLGWSLPAVQSFDGTERPLYMQCIFPYFVVEQTRGWSTVQPPLPTQFRIRDAHKRAVEFLLNLDAHQVALMRQELLIEKVRIEADWKAHVTQVLQLAEMASGIVQSLPRQPTSSWPPRVAPSLMVPSGDAWISLAARLQGNRTELSQLVEQEIPRVQEIASAAQVELNQTERQTRNKQALFSRLLDALEMEQDEVNRLEHRLAAIDEDIQRHKDVRTLQRLGSRQGSSLDVGHCPTCHQPVQDSKNPLLADQTVMSLEDNIQFLTEQRRTFELVLANARRVSEARSTQTHAANHDLVKSRDRVRALHQTLISDGRLPSVAAIRTRMELEYSIRCDEVHLAQFSKGIEFFRELAGRWGRCQTALKALPQDDVTNTDRAKLESWSQLIRVQLAQFGFKSFAPSHVMVSPDSYRPEHEGFDLQSSLGPPSQTTFQLQNSISASDLIRTIWAYLNGMLEMARSENANHLGCILFDEPRQQGTRDLSFAAASV